MAEAYFSNMTDGRPCSVVLGVSSTIPLKGSEEMCVCVLHTSYDEIHTKYTEAVVSIEQVQLPLIEKHNYITVHTIAHKSK